MPVAKTQKEIIGFITMTNDDRVGLS